MQQNGDEKQTYHRAFEKDHVTTMIDILEQGVQS